MKAVVTTDPSALRTTQLLDDLKTQATMLLWYKKPERFFYDIYGLRPYPYQEKVMKELSDLNIHRILVMASGGSGKTKLIAAHTLWLTVPLAFMLKRPVQVVVISGSEDQAKNLYNYIKDSIKNTPEISKLVDGEPLATETRFKDGSEIKAVPNSQKAIQGLHKDVVIVDEAVLAGDFVLRDAFRITVKNNSLDRIIFLGTPMQYDSLFVEMYMNEKEYPEWKRYHWSNADCPNISKQRLEEAKKLSPDVYAIFWEGKPYAVMDTLIPFDYLKRSTYGIELSYEPSFDTYGGIDWGYEHETALTLAQWNHNTKQWQVFYNEGWRREEFSDMHKRIAELCKQFKVKVVYCDASDIGENQRLSALGINVVPIIFKNERVIMQSNLKALFYSDKILIDENLVPLKEQLKKYTWDTKKHDDRVDSLMLAVRDGDLSEKDKETPYIIDVVRSKKRLRY